MSCVKSIRFLGFHGFDISNKTGIQTEISSIFLIIVIRYGANIFTKVKNFALLKRELFDSIEEIQANSEKVLKTL